MTQPKLDGFDPSGWHLHQSLTDASGKKNLFMPNGKDTSSGDPLSPVGMHYLAGLLAHAQATTPFTTPTTTPATAETTAEIAHDMAKTRGTDTPSDCATCWSKAVARMASPCFE